MIRGMHPSAPPKHLPSPPHTHPHIAIRNNQASVVAEAKKEGKVASFKKGKLMVGPKRPDSRSYAEVAASDDTGDRTARDNTRAVS